MPLTDIATWLQKNMEENNWGVRETARRAGLSHPTVSDIFNGKQPSLDTCKALAKLFKTDPEIVLQMAGHLPKSKTSKIIEQIEYMASELPEEEQQDILEFIKLRTRIAEERGKYKSEPKNKPRTASSG